MSDIKIQTGGIEPPKQLKQLKQSEQPKQTEQSKQPEPSEQPKSPMESGLIFETKVKKGTMRASFITGDAGGKSISEQISEKRRGPRPKPINEPVEPPKFNEKLRNMPDTEPRGKAIDSNV